MKVVTEWQGSSLGQMSFCPLLLAMRVIRGPEGSTLPCWCSDGVWSWGPCAQEHKAELLLGSVGHLPTFCGLLGGVHVQAPLFFHFKIIGAIVLTHTSSSLFGK